MKIINWFRGDYGFLSNFYPCKIVIGNLTFWSTESAYQALKCTEYADMVQFCKLGPDEAKYRARELKRAGKCKPNWEDMSLEIMEDLIRVKFSVHQDLKQKLLDTGDAELIEGNNWGDVFWGQCNGVGENHLGKILMKIREELRRNI
jgi:ribA/ribD-fused uncharacterized protein